MRVTLLFFLCFLSWSARAQPDPEFPKGAVLYLHLQQGVNTSFDPRPDLYVGGMGLSAQYTLMPQRIRLGVGGELVFTGKKIIGLAGPGLSWKIKTFRLRSLGSLMNLQLQMEHLWETGYRKLAGGSLGLEIFQLFSLRLMAHREYVRDDWWFRAGMGLNLLNLKKKRENDDPMEGL